MATERRATTPGEAFQQLADIMARLRGPGGCPWDREQTIHSLRGFVLEETYEVLDAIESGDPARLREELGDLLFNVVMLAQMAQDAGAFSVSDVPAGIAQKMIERHPHVFGTETGGSIADWERRKAAIWPSTRDLPTALVARIAGRAGCT